MEAKDTIPNRAGGNLGSGKWKLAQWLEALWWKRYLSKKDPAVYLEWKRNYWRQLLEKLSLAPFDDQRVLDAGCGPAGIFIALQNCRVEALDPLLDKYEQDLAIFSREMYPQVRFLCQPLEGGLESQRYQVVFCMNAINHVSDIGSALNELAQSLETGGQFVLTIDAHNYSFFRWLFRVIPGDMLHPHQYNLKEYQRLLTDRNIQIQSRLCLKKEFFFDHWVIVGEKMA